MSFVVLFVGRRELVAHELVEPYWIKLGVFVMSADRLDDEVDELVATLLDKPRHPIQSTKAGVNAVTESMVGTGRSWNDVDSLLTGLRDPEGRASAAAYLERLKARRR